MNKARFIIFLLLCPLLMGGEYYSKIGLLNVPLAERMHTKFEDWKLLDVKANQFVDRTLKKRYPNALVELDGADDVEGWVEFSAMDNETYISVEKRLYGVYRWYYIGNNANYKKYRRHE